MGGREGGERGREACRFAIIASCPLCSTMRTNPPHTPHKHTGQAPPRYASLRYCCRAHKVCSGGICIVSSCLASLHFELWLISSVSHPHRRTDTPHKLPLLLLLQQQRPSLALTNGSDQGADQAAGQGAFFIISLVPPSLPLSTCRVCQSRRGHPQRRSKISWQYIALSKHPLTNLYPACHPFLGIDPPSFPPSHPPSSLPLTTQALNKHYRKKIIRKNFGVHGDHEGMSSVQSEAW